MYRTLLVERDATVKVAEGVEKVKSCLAVVAFVGVVDLGLGEKEEMGAERVPLQLRAISLEERLLARRWRRKGVEPEDLDAGWLAFLLRHEHRDRGVKSRRQGYGRRAFDFELLNDAFRPVRWLEDLDIIANQPDGVRLGDGVLDFPSVLCLLRKSNELRSCRHGEDAEVFVLRAIL